MGWFDEQIEYRKKRENELLNASFQNLAKSVSGHRIGSGFYEEEQGMLDAISQLLKYFGIREKEIPDKLTELEDRLDYLLSATGIMYREIRLSEGWYKDAAGVMMTTLKEDGTVITITPGSSGGFIYVDPHTGRKKRINKSEAQKFGQEAFCFYRSLPMRKLELYDLWKFMLECLTAWDIASYCLAAFAVTLVGMLMPKLNRILMNEVAEYKHGELLGAVICFMLTASVGYMMFSTIRDLILQRIVTKISLNNNAAAMLRVLSLPADFFKRYSSGELNQYLDYYDSVCSTMVDAVLTTGITGVFSLVYLFQIFAFAKALIIPSLLVTILTLAVGTISALAGMKISKERMKLSAKEQGLVLSVLSGIQKIRLSGAEKRVFAKWAELYAKVAAYQYNPPAIVKTSGVITRMISLLGTLVIYFVAVKSHVSVADYYAFNAAYAYISSAFSAIASIAVTAAGIKPVLEMIKPLLDAQPEVEENLETVTDISGAIEMSHISFRYEADGPLILDDLSLSIPAKQYVAIVGKTGCGKSTLMRLLLGFEKPTAGSVFYDKKDTRRLDMKSLRKNIGTVMQDGKLFQGSLYENITISAPTLTAEDAWRAAEIAGIADDIRRMPLEMHTMVAEGSGGISGGQKQRLMIARAVAPRPKILFFDEATSALDNITQKHVAEALDGLNCTRIVIAHRLSTIKNCDRILVLDKGKIIEDGTYEELIERKGFFAELVERQRL